MYAFHRTRLRRLWPASQSRARHDRRKLQQKPVEWIPYLKEGFGFEARRGSVYDVDFVHELVVGYRNGTFNVTRADLKWAWAMSSTTQPQARTAQIRLFAPVFHHGAQRMLSGKDGRLEHRRKLNQQPSKPKKHKAGLQPLPVPAFPTAARGRKLMRTAAATTCAAVTDRYECCSRIEDIAEHRRRPSSPLAAARAP